MLSMKLIGNTLEELKKAKALELLHQSKSGKKIMVDIEIADERAENAEQRKKCKKFYLRAGYEETSVKYEWRNENYEILSDCDNFQFMKLKKF